MGPAQSIFTLIERKLVSAEPKGKRMMIRALACALVLALTSVGVASAEESIEQIDSPADVEAAWDEFLALNPDLAVDSETARSVISSLGVGEVDESIDEIVVTSEDGSELSLPVDPDNGLEMTSTVEDASVGIGLPGDAQDAVVSSDGELIYEDASEGVDLLVEPNDDAGVRIMTVIEGPNAASSYDFALDLDDGSWLLEIEEDGSVAILDANDELDALIEAPWAFDDSGKEVPTTYTIDGTTLTLHVDHSAENIVYPVVADPSFNWGIASGTFYFDWAETQSIAFGGITAATIAGPAAATIAVFGGPVTAALTAYAATIAAWAALAVFLNGFFGASKCLKVKIGFTWGFFSGWTPGVTPGHHICDVD